MGKQYHQRLSIGGWAVEPETGRLYRDGDEVVLEPRQMDVLVHLAGRQGEVVSSEKLIAAVWHGTIVGDDAIYHCISKLREALGDDSRHPKYIETIPKRGYRFIADVRVDGAPDDVDAVQPAPSSALTSIAVLPMKNLSGRPEQKYFVAGMQDALIADLSKLGALKVISRTSTQQYEDTKKPLPLIGAELGVDLLVEGSVYQVDDRVRITVQLIDAASDDHLWAESYERDLTDILQLQSELARAIAGQIRVTMTPEEEARLADAPKINPDTYNAYLRGMYFVNKAVPEETAKGLATLAGAVEADPKNALAWAGLALAHLLAAHGPEPPFGAYAQAEKAAVKALALDDTLAEAYAARAEGRLYGDWNWDGATEDFRRALELNPSLAGTRAHYSWSLILHGHNDEGLAQMKRAIELDPLTPLWPAWHGWQYWEMGQLDLAIQQARKSLELDEDFPVGLYVLGGALAAAGSYDEAIAAHQKAAAISPEWNLGLPEVYALAGRGDEARAELARMEQNFTTWDTHYIARGYLYLGDKDDAFKWLMKACEEPHHPYIPWISIFTSYDSLRDDPRFARLLQRMNLLP